ncbi:MAG: hypothetical protein R3E90_11360 [Marinicella sp.]
MSHNKSKSIIQYLQSYSYGIDTAFFDVLCKSKLSWEYVIIIPVCDESAASIRTVVANVKSSSCLIIVCVNRPEKHTKSLEWQQQNQQLIADLTQSASRVIESNQKHQLLLGLFGVDCLLLDFNQQPFEDKKGVGLARKIAADTALDLIDKGWVNKPWIFSTDADVALPVEYCSVVSDLNDRISALSLRFEHCGSDKRAIYHQSQYDFKLKYYQQGVTVINPKYAYIPLGSTLVINAQAYAKVRGFPSRSGGEDFYILNKLAKVGTVLQPDQPIVGIEIRYSDRVPFGTGPAISQLSQSQQQPKYYHPKIFIILKEWRVILLQFIENRQLPGHDYGLNQHWQIEAVLNKALKQFKNNKQWRKFIDDWFDAFKILKSVHFLSEQFLPIEYDILFGMNAYQQLIDLTKN